MYVGNCPRLLVSQSVSFAVEPGLSQTVHGGVLNVEEGAKARFFSSVTMDNIAVDTVDLDNMVHGGCIYNKVQCATTPQEGSL